MAGSMPILGGLKTRRTVAGAWLRQAQVQLRRVQIRLATDQRQPCRVHTEGQ